MIKLIWNPPEEIKKLEEVWMPYKNAILDHVIDGKPLVGVPNDAWEAYKRNRKWAWEQDQ